MTKALLHNLGKSLSFGRLSLLAKVMWPMLIASSDDQGRGTAESDAIKWYVCPNVPEITLDNISGLLDELVEQEMIYVYNCNGKDAAYQIIRWWEYQSLRWARPSKFTPPPDWTDRIRYSDRGNISEVDWDTIGGFLNSTPHSNCIENCTDNLVDNQPNITQPNLTELKVSKDTTLRDFYSELTTAWHNYYPDKRQYGYDTVKAKIAARYKHAGFREHWQEALRMSCNVKALRDEGWFSFEYLIRNDTNYLKLLDGTFAFKDGDKRTDAPRKAKPIDCDDATEFFRGEG